jgi:PAS domain S-box-containing protein
MKAEGLEPDAVERTGNLLLLDADATLDRILSKGEPDEALFMDVIGSRVRSMSARGRTPFIFGEMVALLWRSGRTAAAIRLERLWNGLRKTVGLNLLCAYPIDAFKAAQSEGFLHVCDEHDSVQLVQPIEEPTALGQDGLRAVALIQQKAAAMEAEFAKREKAEAELIRSKDQLTHYLETSSIGLHWVGPDGTILWANKADYEFLGYSREEYIGQHIARFHADPSVIEDILARLGRDEKLKNYEARLRCKDGSIRTVLIDSSVLWEEGRFVHTQCFTRDITRQKEAESHRSRLSAIVESSFDAIISTDTHGRITTWNKAAEQIFGYDAEEIIGKPIALLFPSDSAEAEDAAIMDRLLSGEPVQHYDTLRKRRDGRIIHVSLSTSLIKDESGKVIGAAKIARDITERKNFETTLGESEARFRTLAESAPVFIWMADAEGRYEYVNSRWLDFTGRALADELGDGWQNRIHKDDYDPYMRAYEKAIGERSAFRIEFRALHKDGGFRWLLESGQPRLAMDGSMLGFIGSRIDITDLREAEELLHHSQKMDAVGRLAGGIAHDFNNLLTAINGYADLAMAMESGDPNLPEFISEIRKAGERAATLTRQLLAYSRKQMVQPKLIELNAVVADMDRILRRVIGEDIDLRTDLASGLPRVKIDPGQMEQVIMNLVVNARDAMPTGGILSLRTYGERLEGPDSRTRLEAPPGSYVVLSVRDSGTGMDEQVQSRIFEPFFTTKELGKGTGLGLASVYGVIKQNGGGISLTSKPGEGTEFRIYLPAAPAAEADRVVVVPSNTSRPSPCRATILLCEDEESVRRLLARTLATQGYEVMEARHGEEALSLASRAEVCDLLITDVNMPRMNGFELSKALKASHPGLRVLYITGYSGLPIQEQIRHSSHRILNKPFSPVELLARVGEMLKDGAKP